ncbi:MAG: acyl--CoA ligase [Lachnospiraceae bacterium]|nr:acyl--CoA ligase [Lachnospiraceae bacterium]
MLSEEEQKVIYYVPTFADFLKKVEKDFSDKPATTDGTTTYTFKELVCRVAKRRAVLASAGVKPGDKVGVIARNDLDAMEWFLAVPSYGAILTMLPVQLGAEAITGISMKFGFTALVAADEFKPLTENVKCNVISAKEIADSEAPYGDVKKESVAAIYFTGGTTGAPKGVILTHGAMMRGTLNGTYQPGGIFDHRVMVILPMSHIFGSIMGFLSVLYTGSTVIACTDMRAAVGQIPVLRPTFLVLVPGLVEVILGLAKMKGKGFLGDLKKMIVGAAPVPPRLIKDAAQFDIKLFPGYGLTEGANLTSANIDIESKPESMGKIYPGQEYKVVDGELWIKGDNVMVGYAGNPEETAKVLEDGWLKTGDLVRFDEEGFLYITGRIKNLIILSNGENVSPEELEELFYKDARIKDCLVREMEVGGNTVIGIEILPLEPAVAGLSDEDIKKAMEELAESINAGLPSYMHIAKVIVRKEDFPRTGAMKIDRNKVK